MRSRLTRRVADQTKKNLFLSILGIVVILFLLFKFGVPLLANFTMFVIGLGDNQQVSENTKKDLFAIPPTLDVLPSATNSAQTVITGTARADVNIKLYKNEKFIDEVMSKKDGTFRFLAVGLSKGENNFKVKAIEEGKETNFSNEIVIVYRSEPPELSIDKPQDGQVFTKKDDRLIAISGKTSPGARVTVNDLWAIVDEQGYFSYDLSLKDGENKVKITATDEAGNKTEKEITVTYSP